MSPELCADKPYRDKSDCWALGVMLYEVIYDDYLCIDASLCAFMNDDNAIFNNVNIYRSEHYYYVYLYVLIYQCCTLEHPFEARNQCALIMKIIQSPVKPPPSTSVSAEMINLVLWLLQKDPNNRPSIKDLLNEAMTRTPILYIDVENLFIQ